MHGVLVFGDWICRFDFSVPGAKLADAAASSNRLRSLFVARDMPYDDYGRKSFARPLGGSAQDQTSRT